MLLSITLLILGFWLIMKAAEWLVDGAVAIAKKHQISPLLIGLTLIAFGTSVPEIMVSIMAAIQHKSDLALGNVIGSNIANIGFVLGVTYLIHPLKLRSTLVRQEFTPLFLTMIVTTGLMFDGRFSRFDGVMFMIGLCLLLFYLVKKKNGNEKALKQEVSDEIKKVINYPWLWIVSGLLLLPISAELIVSSSIYIARFFGVSDVVIGLTIVAFGTSLPELATSLTSAFKGHDDMAIGNIIGSNMFNLLAVLPFIVIIHPEYIPHLMLIRDMPVMFIITILLLLITYVKNRTLSRVCGIGLLALYIAYLCLLTFE